MLALSVRCRARRRLVLRSRRGGTSAPIDGGDECTNRKKSQKGCRSHRNTQTPPVEAMLASSTHDAPSFADVSLDPFVLLPKADEPARCRAF